MTMGDFILTAVCYPIEAISRILDIRNKMPIIINITVHFLTWVALSGSSLSLILLNVDKLLYFKYPLSSAFVKRIILRLLEHALNNSAGPVRQVLITRFRTVYFTFVTTAFTAATLLPFRISSIVTSFSDQHEVRM
ncbi:unnamed protein product [Angiostrongylus costaricensis]|uniref:G_PROTEIN_RECEP_F1_2 domain-containing protein n=1 Tax=Angiostrongylus costaricensis TaxID=334426 RepID=A0A0R3Q0X6_ANGCS|nr:unnamed protein product [Angiostrongylus costaricensis]